MTTLSPAPFAEVRQWPSRGVPVDSVALAPAGDRLACGDRRGAISVVRLSDGVELRRFSVACQELLGLAFAPAASGRDELLCAGDDHLARLIDPADGREKVCLAGHQGRVTQVAFSPDGKWIASGSHDRTARLWHAETGAMLREFKGHTGTVWSVEFSADGQRLLTGSGDRTAAVWSVENGEKICQCRGHQSWVYRARFSPDGTRILTASNDKQVRLFAAKDGKLQAAFEGHHGYVADVQMHPDNARLVTICRDGFLRLAAPDGAGYRWSELAAHPGGVHTLAMGAEGKTWATAGEDGRVRLWSLA